MRLGVLGGTFDPIHRGHLALALAAKKQFQLERVLFIPAFVPPHKSSSASITPANDRYQMVQAAICPYPDFEVSDIELVRGGVSYTVDTLVEIQKRYPSAKIFLLLGADILSDIPTWREWETIRREVTLVVARRPGTRPSSPYDLGVEWLDMEEYPVSSTMIRGQIRKGKFPKEALPENVAAWIRARNLYQGSP